MYFRKKKKYNFLFIEINRFRLVFNLLLVIKKNDLYVILIVYSMYYMRFMFYSMR